MDETLDDIMDDFANTTVDGHKGRTPNREVTRDRPKNDIVDDFANGTWQNREVTRDRTRNQQADRRRETSRETNKEDAKGPARGRDDVRGRDDARGRARCEEEDILDQFLTGGRSTAKDRPVKRENAVHNSSPEDAILQEYRNGSNSNRSMPKNPSSVPAVRPEAEGGSDWESGEEESKPYSRPKVERQATKIIDVFNHDDEDDSGSPRKQDRSGAKAIDSSKIRQRNESNQFDKARSSSPVNYDDRYRGHQSDDSW